jgi:hypothetical protein
MKVAKEYLIAIIVSLEFLVLATCLLVLVFWLDEIRAFSSYVPDELEVLKHFALSPSAFAGWVFLESQKLLFPGHDKKAILHDWPDYWRLKVHFHVGLLYAGIFAVMGLVVWVFGIKINEPMGFSLLFTSTVGSLIVVLSVYLAKIRVSEILIVANKS